MSRYRMEPKIAVIQHQAGESAGIWLNPDEGHQGLCIGVGLTLTEAIDSASEALRETLGALREMRATEEKKK